MHNVLVHMCKNHASCCLHIQECVRISLEIQAKKEKKYPTMKQNQFKITKGVTTTFLSMEIDCNLFVCPNKTCLLHIQIHNNVINLNCNHGTSVCLHTLQITSLFHAS